VQRGESQSQATRSASHFSRLQMPHGK
jgi:hypothetical protein